MKIPFVNRELTFQPVKKSGINFNDAIKWLFGELGSEYGKITEGTAYEKHVWVYACINAIARNIARVPFKIYKGEREQTGGQPHDLFQFVNSALSHSQLWEGTEIYKNITGNCYWYLERNGSKIIAIYFLDPYGMKPVASGRALLGWEYQKNGIKTPFDLDEIVHFQYFNPYNDFIGLSPLKSAMLSVETDEDSRKFNKNIIDNGSYPGSVIETDKNLTDAQFERLKKQFEQRHKGVKNVGKLGILEGGAKYKEVKITPEEMRYIESRRMSHDEIHSIYRVPTAITGDTTAFNRANMEYILKEFWTMTLIPELKHIEDKLQASFFNKFFPGYTGKFDTSVIQELRVEYETLADTAYKLWSMGIPLFDINDKLNLGFDLTKYPWTRTWWVPFNLVPVGDAGQTGNTENQMLSFKKTLDDVLINVDDVNYRKWKALMNYTIPLERKYQNKLSSWIFDLRKTVLGNMYSRVRQFDQNEAFFDFDDEYKKLLNISTPYLSDAVLSGGKTALAEVNIGADFSLNSSRAIDYVNRQKIYLKQIPETIRDNLTGVIRDTLQTGLEQALTNAEISSNIIENTRHMFDVASNRAKIIARTEIHSAANGGRIIGWQENGVEKHQWLNSFDDRVRETHENGIGVGGEIVPVGEQFSNGLKWPGDKDGDASEIINCRCTTIAILEE